MARGALTVLHASDLQVGKPFQPRAADALVDLFTATRPDVVVVSGDITQRAKAREFALARTLLDRFGDVPIVLTPGNHDVPLYRPRERLATPFKQWYAFMGTRELDTVTRVEGATFVALNSAAPRRAIVNGRIDDHQLDFAREAFAQTPDDDLRIVVIHHHFVPAPDGDGGRTLPRAREIVAAFEEMGVHAVLGGHVHQLHFNDSSRLGSTRKPALPILAAGTATSWRGRGVEARHNSVCVLRFGPATLTVSPWMRSPEASAFEPLEAVGFPLPNRAGTVELNH